MNKLIIFFILLFGYISNSFGSENSFYLLHDKAAESIATLSKHLNVNPIIIAQSYRVEKNGDIAGSIDKVILDFSHQHSVRLMALVTNSSFDSDKVHLFLLNPKAQQKTLNTLLKECQKNHLYGIQFDFEMVKLRDRSALTAFYINAANLLHKNNFKVSFAVAPTVTDNTFMNFYQKRLYEVWQGAYDLKILGNISDFITIMTYDQHLEGTIPGPIASYPWVEQVIKHAITLVPSNKISLGIPTYSGFWYMGLNHFNQIKTQYSGISYPVLLKIINKFHPQLYWDPVNKVNYSFFQYYWLNKFLFIEDKKSFQPKYNLVNKYHLRGISVFRVGIEDPKVWGVIS